MYKTLYQSSLISKLVGVFLKAKLGHLTLKVLFSTISMCIFNRWECMFVYIPYYDLHLGKSKFEKYKTKTKTKTKQNVSRDIYKTWFNLRDTLYFNQRSGNNIIYIFLLSIQLWHIKNAHQSSHVFPCHTTICEIILISILYRLYNN